MKDILAAVRSEREISEATDKKLAAFMDEFTSAFA